MGSQRDKFEKAERDPFFASVIQRYGVEYLESSGFFDDGVEGGLDMAHRIDHRLPVTSLHKLEGRLRARTDKSDRMIVLVTTGGFCPVHAGHLSMMESAREELESRGMFVAAGFIAPDHDQYVQAKCGEEAIPAEQRVELVREATASSAWLDVDPWAALYLDRAVNFTDYIRRMEAYLSHHTRASLEVFYVCGLDNAGFARAFMERNGVVIVPRAGISWRYSETQSTGRIIFCKNHHSNGISSRNIRGNRRVPHVGGAGADRGCDVALIRDKVQPIRDRISVLLRDEQDWGISHWISNYGSVVRQLQRDFVRELLGLLDRSFSEGYPQAWLSVGRLPLSLQEIVVRDRMRLSDLSTISLDACLEGEWNIEVSRLFEMSSSKRLPGLIPRPGSPELAAQIAAIPPGEYALLDDDIATGATIRALLKQLPSQVQIKDLLSAQKLVVGDTLNTAEGCSEGALNEIGDVRDFLLGARHGGLVVKTFDGRVIRVPYLQPYVRNATRMSLPFHCEHRFSLDVWRLNRDFFTALPGPVLVKECGVQFQDFASYVGFGGEDTLLEIAAWHVSELEKAGT